MKCYNNMLFACAFILLLWCDVFGQQGLMIRGVTNQVVSNNVLLTMMSLGKT